MKLRQVIAQYAASRKALGESFKTTEHILKAFCHALGDEAEILEVEANRVQAFLDGAGSVTCYWHRKHDALRGFYRYAISRGYVATSPLPKVTPKQPPRFVPYIYTRNELRRLLDSVASYRNRSLLVEPHTFRALLLLLYGAGLRIGEALALTLADVDLPSAMITIRDTKFYKTRMVALGSQLQQAMIQYATRRQQAGHSQSGSAPFFVARTGARLKIPTIQQAFRCLRAHAGISRTDGARYQPRLHDLRHAFAVHRLTAWYQEGKDVQKLLPLLATYLGHVELASTQVYLTMTPELLDAACTRFEQYAFQEVSHD